MKITEILVEVTVGTVQVGDWAIDISDHAYDRADDRIKSNYASVDSALKKVPAITKDLARLDVNSMLWAYDEEQNISIGLRRRSGNRVLLGTVVSGRAWGRTDVVSVDLPKNPPGGAVKGSFVELGKTIGKTAPTVRPVFRGPAHMPDHEHDHDPHHELKVKPLKIVPDMLK